MANRRAALSERKKRLEAAKDNLAPIVRLLSRSIFTEPAQPPQSPIPSTPSTEGDILVQLPSEDYDTPEAASYLLPSLNQPSPIQHVSRYR